MIDFDAFVSWCERHFDRMKVTADEVKLNSIFDPDGDDHKYKLWCAPGGGKDKREDGVYHCWISGQKGTLTGLVMRVEGCGYEEAREILGGEPSLAALESRLEEIFAFKEKEKEKEKEKPPAGIVLPEGSCPITSLYRGDRRRLRAEGYLRGRGIPPEGFHLGVSGDYKDRIIIPYYDRGGSLVYFNGRHLWRDNPKYLGPPKEVGVGKGDVVYMPSWPAPGSPLYVTEGEFDAFSLHLCGLDAASVGGSSVSWNQIKVLREYDLILAVDNDDAGQHAVARMGDDLRDNGVSRFRYVRPPVGVKDWNEFLGRSSHAVVRKYATERAKRGDSFV